MPTGGSFLSSKIKEREVFCPEKFSETHIEFAKVALEFAKHEVLPRKDEIEKFNKDLTLSLIKSCGDLGLLGVDIPEKYGGLSGDKITSALLVEKLSFGRSESFTVTFSVHTGIGTLPIVYFGNQLQREKYLPQLAKGIWLSSYALTEASAGSDALSLRSTAQLTNDGNYYLLNGSKQFISNAGWAKIMITFAKIDGDKLTCFIVDPESEGVIQHEETNKLGLHGSSTSNIIFENVKVPTINILGGVGNGAEIALNSLNIGRFKLGAAVLGGCKTAISDAVKYALERRQFGQSIAYFEAIRQKIADMVVRTYALESIIYETASLLDESISQVSENAPDYSKRIAMAIESFAPECSICKVYGSEAFWKNADEGIQILGGYGVMEEYPFARMMRDTRVDRIYEGTNEINRQIILGYILKKTLLEELPIREIIKELSLPNKIDVNSQKQPILVREIYAVELAKKLTLYTFTQALTEFGQDLLNNQQIGELLSDMISDVFIMNSTMSRILQTHQNLPYASSIIDIVRVLVVETSIELIARARKIIWGTLSDKNLKNALKTLKYMENQIYIPTNIFVLKSNISDRIYQLKQYPI